MKANLAIPFAFVLLAGLPSQAVAQAETDPYAETEEAGADPSPWRPFADLQIRGDRTSGLPAGRDDLERLRAQLRLGVAWDRGGAWSAGIAAIGQAGSDANRDNVRNNDNRRSDDVGLDQAWVQWRTGADTRLRIGKAPSPLALTQMVWDPDLRPVGLSLSHSRTTADFDRWQWGLAAFDIDHPLASGPRLYAAQLGWHRREGAPLAFSAVVSLLAFDRLDGAVRAGLGRGNPLLGKIYRDDYRLADLQLALRRNAAEGPAWEIQADLLRNTAADRDRDGARIGLLVGGTQPGEWQWEYAYQRIQAAAALAAVNSDDWWFHAGARGHMLAAAYAFDETWRVRIAGFSETRDGLDEATRRVLLDLEARW